VAPKPVSAGARLCYHRRMKTLLAAAFIALLADAPLADPEAEARAQALMREIRCVACENEPVSQSSAPIAEDMRVRIRELVDSGASDTEVRDWFVSRYGDFVLFRPPARDLSGWVLWGLPFLLLAVGGATALRFGRKAGSQPSAIEAEDV
jgi:cytochrome c-type biogenesis protein CcmH